jgi:hypothetical protein
MMSLINLGNGAEAAPPVERIATITLADGGRALSGIVVATNASSGVREAAARLGAYLERSTGGRFAVRTEDAPRGTPVSIYCGDTQPWRACAGSLGALDEDGFAILFPDAHTIIIGGGTEHGVDNGVTAFLERFVGVRWLFPGELGEHVPQNATLAVPAEAVREEPVFQSRLLSGLISTGTPAWKQAADEWGRRLRMRGRVAFHHNLWKIFLPSTYTSTHPDFFPMINGRRYLPRGANQDTVWQPCFGNPDTASEAVQNIASNYFAKLGRDSVSLGVNDNGGFCECAACRALNGERVDASGIPSSSGSYYPWCNAVVRRLKPDWPDKQYGLLAYSAVSDPPDGLTLEPAIIPYLTEERLRWIDPAAAATGHARVEAWARVAAQLGWYDYVYGKSYAAPRFYPHQMATYLRYGQAHGVRHYYAEAYPDEGWSEGPKLYVLLKLLWNPHLDVDALLDDWYTCAVGPTAAPHLKAYFAFWERFWTERVPGTVWFQDGKHSTFLPYAENEYLKALTRADLDHVQGLLAQTVATAGTAMEARRARFFLDGFAVRRRLIETYFSFVELNAPEREVAVRTVLAQTGFDKGFEGWDSWQRAYSKGRFSHDSEQGRTAPGCLKLDANGAKNGPMVFTHEEAIVPGKLYAAAIWCRVTGMQGAARVTLHVKWKDADLAWIAWAAPVISTKAQATGDWERLQVRFQAPAAPVAYAVLMPGIEGAVGGTVWFDDFTFGEIEGE